MIKYYIDTSLTGVIGRAATTTTGDVTPGKVSVDYSIQVMVGDSTKFANFCNSVTLNGESQLLYYNEIKDGTRTLIIPANTTIENYGTSNTYNYCRVVPYQTES